MIKGCITAKDILLHPLVLISAIGFKRYLFILIKCMDHTTHSFTDLFMR